ncbi:MAG: YvcK family protein, partial [Deltaproteobacteria bacterium]|nr:YvcK family protein [Deltaproteobacteria bacterium]
MILNTLKQITEFRLSPLDYLPQEDLREKVVDLALRGVPSQAPMPVRSLLEDLRKELVDKNVEDVRVVVFGGGTGLSNIIGGDCRIEGWEEDPFYGLKEIFPLTKSIVCVTDDGGSTGELLKDLPLVAIGDIRHVLLSSVQLKTLQDKYDVTRSQATEIAAALHTLFNYRSSGPIGRDLPSTAVFDSALQLLPTLLKDYLEILIGHLSEDIRFAETLRRPHCLGNLLVAAAVFKETGPGYSSNELADRPEILHRALIDGVNHLTGLMGGGDRAVLPCTSTPAQLRVHYTNGVEIIGENKLGDARRGVPVESVHVDYFDEPRVAEEVLEEIARADILVLAPGSLYSSIIPVFKVPGLAECVRANNRALKILISNLWVQAGETDLSIADPERKFHVSDMIKAYERNIPGGTTDLFDEVLAVSLKDIP